MVIESQEPAPAGYRHRSKIAAPREDLVLPGIRLKWYDLQPEEYVVTDALSRESRERIRSDIEEKRIDFGSTMGFVILHIAGSNSGVGMLIVNTWRNCNEIWETVYLKDLPQDGPYGVYERSGHLPTYCVWELGIVWHERNAFARYLLSARDAAAASAYFADRYSGMVES
jgi:hypothetical protein